jgi:Flp pilus assembly protein TadG
MKKIRDESGQTLIFVALSMTCILGFVGLATDVGTMFYAKRNLQTAADAAAIAGAAELPYGTTDMTTSARGASAQNGFTNGVNGVTVSVNPSPQSGAYQGLSGYVEAIVSQPQPTFFMHLFQRNSMTVAARAVATNGASNGCIYTLGTSGTDILMNGNVNLTATFCSIIDDSTSTGSALLANGNVTLNAQSIGIVGGVLTNGHNNITPAPVTGIVPVADPLAFETPPSNPGGCVSGVVLQNGISNSYGNGSSFTLPAGCYNGLTINGSPTVTLGAGVFYMNGPMVVNGSPTVNGTNVTIYLPNSSASFTDNGATTLNLSAPNSGAYSGILFYQNPADTSTLTINGSSSSTLKGIFYVPNANLTVNGSGSTNFYTSFVVSSLTFNGNGTLKDYASINGGSPLTSTRLVE